jgi:hypothetical protein
MDSNSSSTSRGATGADDCAAPPGKPIVFHPQSKLDSETHVEIANIIRPHDVWFMRGRDVVVVDQVANGFKYAEDNDEKFTLENQTAGFAVLSAMRARATAEKFMVPTVRRKRGNEYVDEPKSFTAEFCAGMLASPFLRDNLSRIHRILTVPLPFKIGEKLIYPREGYDPRFGTYLLPSAPKIQIMPIEEAKKNIEWIYREFCFTKDGRGYSQSRVNAVARLIAPFARAIIGWATRVPLWYFFANRPRAGKDYCAGVTLVLYEGQAFEDQPIGDNSEETRKRLIAAYLAGRRFMHFANCTGYLRDPFLMQAVTSPTHGGRILGSSTDAMYPNEQEYSVSANLGHTVAEDYLDRICRIELAYFVDNPNDRKFETRFLHREILERRSMFLSSIAALYDHWAREKFPTGATSSLSFPHCSDAVGGVMRACDLGDPFLPFLSQFGESGAGINKHDQGMRALYRACYEREAEKLIKKERIFEIVDAERRGGNDTLNFFGKLVKGYDDSDADKKEIYANRQRLSQDLRKYEQRELVLADGDGRFFTIQLRIDRSKKESQRHEFMFHKL